MKTCEISLTCSLFLSWSNTEKSDSWASASTPGIHHERGKGYTLHVHDAGVDSGERDTLHVQTAVSGKWYTLHVQRRLLNCWCCNSCYMMYMYNKCRMPEKVRPASASLPVVNCLSPASGLVRYRWSRISPALPSNVYHRSVDFGCLNCESWEIESALGRESASSMTVRIWRLRGITVQCTLCVLRGADEWTCAGSVSLKSDMRHLNIECFIAHKIV